MRVREPSTVWQELVGAADVPEFAPEFQAVEAPSIVTGEEFAAIEEPGSDALIGDAENKLIPENADVMFYGDGGAGKTTLTLDGACHLAAGDDWLTIPVPRAVRVLMVENEGPRALFRDKIRRKLAGWQGSPLADRLLFWEQPWAEFTFANTGYRQVLASELHTREIDVVVIGPLTASGMLAAGTLQEVREFTKLLDEVRAQAGRRITFVVVHHENRAGKVSGAWEGCGDTLFHVQAQGHGRTRVYVQKARWASAQHGTALHLLWADGEGFQLEEKPEVDDEAIADLVVEFIRANAGTGWTKVRSTIKGVDNNRIDAVRDGLFAARKIANLQKVDGAETLIYEVRERVSARLFVADDPAITHLCRSSSTDAAQTVLPWEAGQ